MIEIQCTSCHTRYRIDERVLPDETPTFKCSRCGHVFNAEPVGARMRKAGPLRAVERPQAPPPLRTRKPEPEPERPEVRDPEPAPPPEAESDASAQPEFHTEPEQRLESDQPAATPAVEEHNPLDRTFSSAPPGDVDAGENLSFDFTSEPKPGEPHAESADEQNTEHSEDHWEVGEPPEESSVAAGARYHKALTDPEPKAPTAAQRKERRVPLRLQPELPPIEEFRVPEFAGPSDDGERARRKPAPSPEIPNEVAYFAAHRPAHSSAWFIGLFAFIVLVFGGLSFAVHVQPADAVRLLSQAPRVGQNFQPPMVPAMLVALHDVHADYQKVKGGQTALLISGTAENVGAAPLHAILLAVDLLDDSGKQMAGGAAYCGTGLSVKMVGEMTPREIEFLQRLDPQKNFAVPPSQSAPFLLVFIEPPRKVANLRIQVAKAIAVQNAAEPRS